MDEITIELKKSEFRSGETIEGYYSINEDFPGASRVTLTLRAKKDTMLNLEFDRAGENELEVNRQVVLHEGSVFAENCQSVPFSVKLPEGLYPSFSCRGFSVKWFLEIEIDVFGMNPKEREPITINTGYLSQPVETLVQAENVTETHNAKHFAPTVILLFLTFFLISSEASGTFILGSITLLVFSIIRLVNVIKRIKDFEVQLSRDKYLLGESIPYRMSFTFLKSLDVKGIEAKLISKSHWPKSGSKSSGTKVEFHDTVGIASAGLLKGSEVSKDYKKYVKQDHIKIPADETCTLGRPYDSSRLTWTLEFTVETKGLLMPNKKVDFQLTVLPYIYEPGHQSKDEQQVAAGAPFDLAPLELPEEAELAATAAEDLSGLGIPEETALEIPEETGLEMAAGVPVTPAGMPEELEDSEASDEVDEVDENDEDEPEEEGAEFAEAELNEEVPEFDESELKEELVEFDENESGQEEPVEELEAEPEEIEEEVEVGESEPVIEKEPELLEVFDEEVVELLLDLTEVDSTIREIVFSVMTQAADKWGGIALEERKFIQKAFPHLSNEELDERIAAEVKSPYELSKLRKMNLDEAARRKILIMTFAVLYSDGGVDFEERFFVRQLCMYLNINFIVRDKIKKEVEEYLI
ncbi:MAG: hypothetical protein GY757_26220 [bacterium]|nr:hypothetical protein [bacterium]